MIERVNPDKPNDNYNYMMGDINVHSPTIVEKDGGWKWYKDGELEKLRIALAKARDGLRLASERSLSLETKMKSK